MLNYLLDEQFCPSSRSKASKLDKIRETLQDYGVNPDLVEFEPSARKWG